MATTKLLRIKQSGVKNKAAHLKNSIFYICNPDKTDGGIYVGGNAGLHPEIIYKNMMRNKSYWKKEDKTQGFHYMIAFPPDCKVDEALAFQIGLEFAQELLGEEFYFTIAVHNDKPHIHVHLVFDSVSRMDGHKFHSPKGDWARRIQPISDRLCKKYQLPALDYDPDGDRKGKNYGDWKRENIEQDKRGDGKTEDGKIENTQSAKSKENGSEKWRRWTEEERQAMYTWRDIVRDDIDEAVEASKTYEEFLEYLKKDYLVRDKKYLSLRPRTVDGTEVLKLPGNGAVRTGRLGAGYGKEEIQIRIRLKQQNPEIEKRYKTYGDREEMRAIIYAKVVDKRGWRMSPMQKQFYRRWNFTCFVRRPEYPKGWKIKKDILEIQKLSEAIYYMLDFDVNTLEDLQKRKESLQEEGRALEIKQEILRTHLLKTQPNYLVCKYEKLQKECAAASDPEKKKELQLQMEQLKEKIEAVLPLDEAVKKREELQKELKTMREVIRDNKKERRLVEDIFRLFYEMETEPEQKKREAEKNDRQEEETIKHLNGGMVR